MEYVVEKGFVSAQVSALPKGVMMLTSEITDGVYMLAADFVIKYEQYGTGIQRAALAKRTLKEGTVIVATEGGHYYRFGENGDVLTGLGKRNGTLAGAIVQRISITKVEFGAYVKPKKAPAKKKVAKKKKKKKAVRKK